VRRRKENPDVVTYGEVWKGLKSDLRKAPRGFFELIFSLDTYLLLACFVAVPTIYYVGTALLFSYLPGRLYGAVKQSWVWDSLLGLLLGVIAGLYLWGKFVQPRREQAERLRRYKRLRAELGPIQERVAEVIMRRGKEGHPEVRFWGKRMEEPEPLRVVAIPAAAGSRPQEGGDLFDGRTTLLALGVILGGILAMTVVIVGCAYAVEVVFSLF